MKISAKATATSRTHLSVHHALAAGYFSAKARNVETENTGNEFSGFWEEILWLAIGCVQSSVAALEAYANELFVDYEKNFPSVNEDLFTMLWAEYERKPLLEKFEFAALLLDKKPLEKGTSPYQDVAALVALRNALIHFKPEWLDEQVLHGRVSKLLVGRFEASPFLPESEPVFPKRWASYGCTRWAVKTILLFSKEFAQRVDLDQRFEKFESRVLSE